MFQVWFRDELQPVGKGLDWRSAFHAAALVRTFGVVDDEEGIEVLLHLVDRLVEGLASLDPEVLVKQRAVQALDEAIGLRATHPGGAMFDAFELQEEFVRVPVRTSAELSSVARREEGLLVGYGRLRSL